MTSRRHLISSILQSVLSHLFSLRLCFTTSCWLILVEGRLALSLHGFISQVATTRLSLNVIVETPDKQHATFPPQWLSPHSVAYTSLRTSILNRHQIGCNFCTGSATTEVFRQFRQLLVAAVSPFHWFCPIFHLTSSKKTKCLHEFVDISIKTYFSIRFLCC